MKNLQIQIGAAAVACLVACIYLDKTGHGTLCSGVAAIGLALSVLIVRMDDND